jgi:hypothetical protein
MNFKIDFFDLMWLAESVIPPRPIARSMCFDSFSETHYHQMTDGEREQFFEHVQKCHGFSLENEQCRHFYARFNPKNQFHVNVLWGGRIETHHCYLWNGRFCVSKNKSYIEENIKKVVRIYDNKEIKL